MILYSINNRTARFLVFLGVALGVVSKAQAEVREYTLVIEGEYVQKYDENGTSIARLGSVVNGTVPGPIIEATEGDTLRIRVINNQDPTSSDASLHWHGMFQPGTPFMDGVPGVAQCGICVNCEMIYGKHYTVRVVLLFFRRSV